jgi:hypothetical protein
MISIVKQPRRPTNDQQNERFIKMIPLIRSKACSAFRRMRPESKDELVQEVVANAFCQFSRLARAGKAELAFATPLADFAIRQVLAGRRVGTKQNCHDVFSALSPRQRGSSLSSLPSDCSASSWSEMLADDTTTPVPDQVAFRLDFPAWLRSQHRRNRNLAKFLAVGNTATQAARRFGVSVPRISQLRTELQASWQAFQGETPVARLARHVGQRAD